MIFLVISTFLFTTFIRCTADQVQFELSRNSLQFTPTDPNDLLMMDNTSGTFVRCITECLNNIRCQTVNFDASIRQCSLFTSWSYEGYISPSSSTSQIGYIVQRPILYTLYMQSCIVSENGTNRYLQCVNGLWICPYGYFFNGNVCESWRSFDQRCQANDWCDESRYLTCSNFTSTCQCNASMSWDEDHCVSRQS